MIKGLLNPFKENVPENKNFSKEKLKEVYTFHKSIPAYRETPLENLENLAKYLGVKNIYVKDESKRFELNAFKGLGVSYAVAKYFSERFSLNMNFAEIVEKTKDVKVTFATATDGNHGKSLAWSAKIFNQKAKVYMPKGSSLERLNAIKSFGADAEITDMNYDDTVRMVSKLAKKNNWILVQDTAWEGYEDIPLAIMQGYSTIISEIVEKIKLSDITHIVLQAGVGSFAGAMAATINNISPNIKIVIVEPEKANCLYKSAKNPKGEIEVVKGDLNTIMAGLACGEPNPIAWEILKSLVSAFYSCEDIVSERGMRVLGNGIGEDKKIISGESGAVPMGFVYEVIKRNYNNIIRDLEINSNSQILIISTEGDTDVESYRKIVWDN